MKRILTFILVVSIAVISLAGCDLIGGTTPGECTEHAWDDATCTSPKTCSICGTTQGEALGHAEESIDGKEATCTATGLTEGMKCSVCNTILVAQEEIPMTDHAYGEDGKCVCGANNGEIPSLDEITVADIRLSGMESTLAFGEELNFDGLEVWAEMKDGSEQLLPSTAYTVTCEDFNAMKVGTYKVEVSLNNSDISASYDVNVAPANSLKVLMIGNSFADDTINYAYEIAKNAGIPEENILIADIYIGGCVLNTHWANAQSNEPAYRFGLEREGWFDGTSYTNWTMEQAIKYADWDFITFQQGSSASGDPTSFDNLQNLMNYVYDIATDEVSNPNANPNVKFAWHETWAYQQGTTAAHFSKYNYDQMTMYNAIVSCMQNHVVNKDFVAIIPNGTAIQNARSSFIGDTFSRDEHNHLSYSAGRYIAAMGLVGTLTGRDMSNITWKPTDSGFNYPLTAEEILVCKESYANAAANPFEVTKSKYPPIPTDLSDLFDGEGTEQSPYLIQSADDMLALSRYTKGKSFTDTNTYFKLTADIDLSAENWTPICSSFESGWVKPEDANSFNANFDGDGHTITFVGNYTGDTWAKGLFSAIGGYVHDLTLRGTLTTEMGVIGSLTAYANANARIENITSYVNITAGNNQIGGIIGYIAAPNVTVKGCKNYGTVVGRELVGGIVGGSWQNVSYIDCENHGDVTATYTTAGGICGEKYAAASLTNCKNLGNVIAGSAGASADVGSAGNYAGYLIGKEYN